MKRLVDLSIIEKLQKNKFTTALIPAFIFYAILITSTSPLFIFGNDILENPDVPKTGYEGLWLFFVLMSIYFGTMVVASFINTFIFRDLGYKRYVLMGIMSFLLIAGLVFIHVYYAARILGSLYQMYLWPYLVYLVVIMKSTKKK